MSSPNQDLDALIRAIEQVETMMTGLQYRVALLKRATCDARNQTLDRTDVTVDQQRLRSSAEKLKKFLAAESEKKQILH